MFFNIYVLITLVLSYMSAPCAGFTHNKDVQCACIRSIRCPVCIFINLCIKLFPDRSRFAFWHHFRDFSRSRSIEICFLASIFVIFRDPDRSRFVFWHHFRDFFTIPIDRDLFFGIIFVI